MNEKNLRRAGVILATLVTLTVNALANALPLNGQTTAEISDRFDVFFVPAGYVFSIWGIIYLGMISYAIFQALPAQNDSPSLKRIVWPFVVSCAANSGWIFLWHYEVYPLTLVFMLILLGSLIVIFQRLQVGRASVGPGMRWFVHLPFSIYLGWITVATIANATSLLYFLEWDGWGVSPEIWTLIMLAAAVVIGAAVTLGKGNWAFPAVLVWAFVGIAVKHQDVSTVATGAWVAAAATSILVLIALFRRREADTESPYSGPERHRLS